MSEHMPTPELVTEYAEAIPGSIYGTGAAAASPMTLDDAGPTQDRGVAPEEDQEAVREAAAILPKQADDMVTARHRRLGELPPMRRYSGPPDGTPNTDYGTASKPRLDRFMIDAGHSATGHAGP